MQTSGDRVWLFSRSLLWVALLSLTLGACSSGGGGSSSHASTSRTLVSLEIQATTTRLSLGASLQLTVLGRFSDDSRYDISSLVSWSSSHTAIATVNASGTVVSLAQGTAQITASFAAASGNITDQIEITVLPPDLVGLAISPQQVSLARGTTAQLSATGLYSDGSAADLTAQVSWLADNPAIASVSAGRVSALASGDTVVSAGLAGITASTDVSVTLGSLQAIEIDYPSSGVPLGISVSLGATGIYSDGQVADLTELVSWSSLVPETATVGADSGLFTALSPGPVTIQAEYDGITHGVAITVSDASLQWLEIQPVNSRLQVGTRQQLSALAHFSDHSLLDFTERVDWSSSDTALASIGDGSDDKGMVNALAVGEPAITASYSSISVSTVLTVVADELTAIHITPTRPVLAVGIEIALTAAGNYASGDSRDLTSQVDWESSDPDIAEVDSEGRVTARQVGTTNISARSGTIAETIELQVSDATLTGITLSSATTTLAAGTQVALTATATFDGAAQQDVTDQVVWSVDDPGLAQVSNTRGKQGILSALASGSVTVTATLGTVSGSQVVTVTGATLTALTITPASNSFAAGATTTLIAIATFSDSSSQDFTNQVEWRSDNITVATVSNADGAAGMVKGISPGSVAISAYYGGSSDSVAITVTDAPTTPVSLTIVATPNTLYADGLDSTTLVISVLTADPTQTVADNTQVNLSLIAGSGVIPAMAYTTGGQATVTLSSDTEGMIEVLADLEGSSVQNTVAVRSTRDFREVLRMVPLVVGDTGGGVLPAGSQFVLFVRNLSNRSFTVNRFIFGEYDSDGNIISNTLLSLDAAQLTSSVLAGGGLQGMVLIAINDFPLLDYAARFELADPATGIRFTAEAVYDPE